MKLSSKQLLITKIKYIRSGIKSLIKCVLIPEDIQFLGISKCHFNLFKEVIKTATSVTKRLWRNLLIAALVSLPVISIIGSSANAQYRPIPPDTEPVNGGRRGTSSR